MHNMVVPNIGFVTDGGDGDKVEDGDKVDEVVSTLHVSIPSAGESAAQSQGEPSMSRYQNYIF